MAKASGSIDLKSLKVAGEGASKYITSIDSNNGIQVHAQNNSSINYTQINASGMQIFKGDAFNSIAEFGDTTYIGKHNNTQSYIQLDYHSLQMISKEGDPYFYVSDLRETSGKAKVSENFTIREDESNPGSPDISTDYLLSGNIASTNDIQEVRINGTLISNYIAGSTTTDTTTNTYIRFTSATGIAVGDLATVVYYSSGNDLKAFTFGTRSYPSYRNIPGPMSVAIGGNVIADGLYSFATGYGTKSYGLCSYAEGGNTIAQGAASHAEGNETTALGLTAHAEGNATHANGQASHAEGDHTYAIAFNSHAEGRSTHAEGRGAHAEGLGTYATQDGSHAEGYLSKAQGLYSHAEGYNTKAMDETAHAEGYETNANSKYSHAEGKDTFALGEASHAQGIGTQTNGLAETVLGTYNIVGSGTSTHPSPDSGSAGYGQYALTIGNGIDENNLSNALTVDWTGNLTTAGEIYGKNHNSAIGTTNSHNDSKSVSSASSPYTPSALSGAVRITSGTWILVGTASFQANTSGVRYLDWHQGSSTTLSNTAITQQAVSTSGVTTKLQTTAIVNVPENSSYDMYLYCYQTSGSQLTVNYYWQIVRII